METETISNSSKNTEDEKHIENVEINENIGTDTSDIALRDYRVQSDDSSTFSDSDSTSCSSLSIEVDDNSPKKGNTCVKITNLKTKGELSLDDLPKIEELNISIPESEIKAIGKISGIVDREVIVSAFKNSNALDIDSILFLSNGKPIGRIFDVFGQVIEPLYSIRFNSLAEIKSKGFLINDIVYYAPENKETTTYVFVDSLQKQKGSDASWTHNNEPPPECVDYSDDEQEKQAHQKFRAKNRHLDIEVVSEIKKNKPSNNFNNNVKYKNTSKSYSEFSHQTFSNSTNNFPINGTTYNTKSMNPNPVGSFTIPSSPHINPVYSPSPKMSSNNHVNQMKWPSLNIQQQSLFEISPNSVKRNLDSQMSKSYTEYTHNESSISHVQNPTVNTNISPSPITSNRFNEHQRKPIKSSAEVLNETFFMFKNVPPPPPGASPPFHLHMNNFNSAPISSLKNSNHEKATVKTEYFEKSPVINQQHESSNTASFQPNHSVWSTYKAPNFFKQNVFDSSSNQKNELISHNEKSSKPVSMNQTSSQITNNVLPGSNQTSFQPNLNISSSSSTSAAFTQHMNPSVLRNAPSPYFVSPYHNWNFCTPPPAAMNIQNSGGMKFRPPPTMSPPVNIIPNSMSPRPWQSFHPPVFGVLPVVNQRSLQMPSTTVVPFLQTQRPVSVPVMPGINTPPPSFMSSRVPFYDPRLPPPSPSQVFHSS